MSYDPSISNHGHHHCYGKSTSCPELALIEPRSLDQEASTLIDASLCFPSLLFFGTAVFWLVVGLFLEFLCASKLVLPSLLDGPAFFTYGRLFPVANDLLVYGWAIPAGLGVMIYLWARLNGKPFLSTRIITMAAILWNIAVFLGSLAILCGYSTSVQWLEYPNWASFLLFVSFLLISINVLISFKKCPSRSLHLSQCYFLTAFCTFPWLYATANLLLTWGHIQGSAQGPIHWWYGSNLIALWLTLVALGTGFYLISKVLGRPLASYYLSLLGFWSFLLFISWNAMTYLIGGPLPAWMVSASVVASFLIIIPVAAVVSNFHQTLSGHYSKTVVSPALRFIAMGILAYLLFTALSLLNAIPSVNAIFHFTDYTYGTIWLAVLGFFSMIMFGAIYYCVPRLLNLNWPSTKLIRYHFWYATVGISLMVLSMTLSGLLVGVALEDPAISFINIISYSMPWHYLNVISWALLIISSSAFGLLFSLMLWQVKNPPSDACCIKIR